MSSSFLSRHKKKLGAALAVLAVPVVAHVLLPLGTAIRPPALAAPAPQAPRVDAATGITRLGRGYSRQRGKILEVRLAGDPEAIGRQHGALLRARMVDNEGTLYRELERHVPWAPARWAIFDVARLRFRHVDRGMSEAHRVEIAAQAEAFEPDPFSGVLPTYHRFVFLQSLYDIALSFEHSPLLGCSSLALGDDAAGGHVLLARNFDFEAGPVFDEGKAVFLMLENGRMPYASVAWPGLVGAVSGMNVAGLGLVVHGGRAREPRTEGEPVVHTLRDVLGLAKTTAEAIELLRQRPAMVSHIVLLADASGDLAAVERAPGEPVHVRRARGKLALTNHFEGPLADDPKNRRVEQITSTRARRARLDELLSNLPPSATVQDAVAILRDRKAVGGAALPLGDRRALDALIATHGVVFDSTERLLWVSEGPHLVGRFVRFDLLRLLDPSYEPGPAEELVTLPPDPIADDGRYAEWLAAGGPHGGEASR